VLGTEIIIDETRLFALEAAWRALHNEIGGSIFETPEWQLAWWAVYRDRFRLRVFAAWDGERLAGLLPCYLGTSFGITYLRLLGEYATYGEYLPLARAETGAEFAQLAARWGAEELRSGRIDLFDFHHFPAGSPLVEAFTAELGERGCRVNTKARSVPRIMMELPASWEEYVDALAFHERRWTRMYLRALERKDPPFTIAAEKTPEALDELVRLHGQLWRSRGSEGFFAERPRFEQFHRLLFSRLAGQGVARVYTLRNGTERVAAVLAYFIHGQCCVYLSGRIPDHPLNKYSPGKALISAVIRDAIREQKTICDLQEGTLEYKFRLGGRLSWFGRTTVIPPGLRAWKGILFLAALHLRALADPKASFQRFAFSHGLRSAEQEH
jgi:CelD/BcsL family acetyltransferase involved in cellulose biosynthesis